MSKSKRAAQGISTPAPRQKKSVFIAEDGGLRTGWLLAVSLGCCAAAAVLARLGLSRNFAALFAAWGIDGTNVHRAPAWARWLYTWHGSLVTVSHAAVLLAASLWLRRLWRCPPGLLRLDGGRLLRSALAGLGGALVVALVCLLPDSLRLEWPITAPHLTIALPALLAVSLLATLAEERFIKGAIFDGVLARWGKGWAFAIACAAFFAISGGWAAGVVGAANVLLLGFLSCLVYAHHGLWAVVGLRWGWSAANMLLLGFGGGDYAVYRLYGVSEKLMTGGDAGPVYGLWTTLLFASAIVAILFSKKVKNPRM